MNRVSVHLDGRPPTLVPCRLADGWAVFEALAFRAFGLDLHAQQLKELWLCTRDGVAESLVTREMMPFVLRDADHVQMRLAPREGAPKAMPQPAAALARASPGETAAAPPATPASDVAAPPQPPAARAAAPRAKPATPAMPPPPAAATAAAAAPASGGEKRAAAAEGGAGGGVVVKRPRTAAASPRAAVVPTPALLLLPAGGAAAENPFQPRSFKHAVFTVLQRSGAGASIPLRELEAATQDLFSWAKARGACAQSLAHCMTQPGAPVAQGEVSLRAPGECGECGECGYCRKRRTVAPAPPDTAIRCKHCFSENTRYAYSKPASTSDHVKAFHRCKVCRRDFAIGTLTVEEDRAAKQARGSARQSIAAGAAGTPAADTDHAARTITPPGSGGGGTEDDDVRAVADTYPEAPCPFCASMRTRHKCTRARMDGTLVDSAICKDCGKSWTSSFTPAPKAAPAQSAVPRAVKPSPPALLAPPAPPPLAVPDAEADACELPTIAPRLWVGAASAAANLGWLRARGITHVVNVASEVPDYHAAELTYHSMNMRDSSDDMVPMMHALPNACSFIDAALAAGGTVLVHCRMGLSRSAAVAVAFAMHRGVAQSDALDALAQGRCGLSINFAFQAMLEMLQQRHAGIDGERNTRSRYAMR